MSDQIKKFLDEEWRHESWEYRNEKPYCGCGEELRDDDYPGRALDEHRVRAALAAAGVAPQPEPEYEYRWELREPDTCDLIDWGGCTRSEDDARDEGSKEKADNDRVNPDLPPVTLTIMRRTARDEGEWEPAPNQEGEQS